MEEGRGMGDVWRTEGGAEPYLSLCLGPRAKESSWQHYAQSGEQSHLPITMHRAETCK